MEEFFSKIPDYKIDAFLTTVGGMFFLGIVIWLLFGLLDAIFNLDIGWEWAVQKLIMALITPAMILIAIGILALIGINVKELIR